MIKLIHKMMRRKGFTLVELIVVIAIVGVLAAILVPTLLGVVTQSRVSSANSTAAEIRRNLNSFMIDAEVDGFCMKQSKNAIEVFDITINDGVWECSSASDSNNFNKRGGTKVEWGNGGASSRCKANEDRLVVTSGEKYMCLWLADLLPTIKAGAIVAAFCGGSCTFVAYSPEQSSALAATEYPAITNGKPASTFAWGGKVAGVSPSGIIIGTAPAIEIA